MTLEDIVRSPELRASARRGPLGPHIDDFLRAIKPTGYATRSLPALVRGAIQFGAYLHEQGITDLCQLGTHHVEFFVGTQPVRRCGKYRYPISPGVRGARHLWRYTCAAGITPVEAPPPAPVYAPVLKEWLAFQERHRGLAPGSLALYRRHIRRFLEHLGTDVSKAVLSVSPSLSSRWTYPRCSPAEAITPSGSSPVISR